MDKRFTGATFTPHEFRLLTQCLRCGKASRMTGSVCEDCVKKEIPNCSMCDILVRVGNHKFYTYDIKQDHRGEEEGFKPSKELVREFEYEVSYKNSINSDGMCNDCLVRHRRDMKNVCGVCSKPFINTKEHYKENGNICEVCSDKCNVSAIIHERNKVEDGGPEREGIRNGSDKDFGVQEDVSERTDRDNSDYPDGWEGDVPYEDFEG